MRGKGQAASAKDMTAMAAEVDRTGTPPIWLVVASCLACHDVGCRCLDSAAFPRGAAFSVLTAA